MSKIWCGRDFKMILSFLPAANGCNTGVDLRGTPPYICRNRVGLTVCGCPGATTFLKKCFVSPVENSGTTPASCKTDSDSILFNHGRPTSTQGCSFLGQWVNIASNGQSCFQPFPLWIQEISGILIYNKHPIGGNCKAFLQVILLMRAQTPMCAPLVWQRALCLLHSAVHTLFYINSQCKQARQFSDDVLTVHWLTLSWQ